MRPRLQCAGLRLRRGNSVVVDGVDADFHAGSLAAVVGPNGGGKSTLLAALAGHLAPAGGLLTQDGKPPRPSPAVAYLPQGRHQIQDVPVTILDVVRLGRHAQVGPWRGFKTIDHAAVAAAVNAMGLDDVQTQAFRASSGGQQQRTLIARALATGAEILILDEPLAGLDEPTSEDLLIRLRAWSQPPRLTVAVIHDLGAVRRHCTHALLLNRRQIAWGETAAVMTHHHLDACFLGAVLHGAHKTQTATP